ncbi:hypothetical protein RIF29_18033 [Crotalaria pallida]|uniref:Bifunctional inhibitor/plant lipid transfer protein/seed storage helical domain-containing protein n=1 Tax=Crotalaria pallida TaxID=3830 RepID=A0AAN9FI87_CROPI
MAPKCLAIAMLLLVAIIELGNVQGISADCNASDIPLILLKCRKFIKRDAPKLEPSKACCESLKEVDLACLCDKYITPPVEAIISVKKAIYVAETCGCTVPPSGAKCGSYVIPAPGPTATLLGLSHQWH